MGEPLLAGIVLAAVQLIGLALAMYSAPGVWLQLAALAAFGYWTEFALVGKFPLYVLAALAVVSEVVHVVLARRALPPAERRKIARVALLGGGAGAALGIRFPLVGSMFGALAGALVGAALASWRAEARAVGWRDLGGHVVATAVRATAAVIVAAFPLLLWLH